MSTSVSLPTWTGPLPLTVASFRETFGAAFRDLEKFPDAAVTLYLTLAANTLDVNRWGRDLGAWLPAGYSANVTCALNPPSTTAVTCEIVLNWAENAVGVNSQQSGVTGASAAFTTNQSPQYTLTVEP